MISIGLYQPTNSPAVDQTLTEIITIIEQHFPWRVSDYYLVGSYAVGEACLPGMLISSLCSKSRS